MKVQVYSYFFFQNKIVDFACADRLRICSVKKLPVLYVVFPFSG